MNVGNPFWAFSVAFYGRSRVAATCLVLQDEYGLDVNVLLLMCWCGLQGVRVEDEALVRLQRDARLQFWRLRVVEPLRRVRRSVIDRGRRRWLRPWRRSLGALELAAEQLEQGLLYAWFQGRSACCQPGPVQPWVMIANLAALWRCHRLPPASVRHAQTLLEEAFPAWAAAEFAALWAAEISHDML